MIAAKVSVIIRNCILLINLTERESFALVILDHAGRDVFLCQIGRFFDVWHSCAESSLAEHLFNYLAPQQPQLLG